MNHQIQKNFKSAKIYKVKFLSISLEISKNIVNLISKFRTFPPPTKIYDWFVSYNFCSIEGCI